MLNNIVYILIKESDNGTMTLVNGYTCEEDVITEALRLSNGANEDIYYHLNCTIDKGSTKDDMPTKLYVVSKETEDTFDICIAFKDKGRGEEWSRNNGSVEVGFKFKVNEVVIV